MKKLLFIIALLPMLAACSKDDEFSLTGKTYVRDEVGIYSNITYNIRFMNAQEFEFVHKSDGEIIESYKSTYVLQYPNISFKVHNALPHTDVEGYFVNEDIIRIDKYEYIRK